MKVSVNEAYRTMLIDYPEILTVQQTATILGCHERTVYKMIDYGYFPAAKPGKGYCISKYGLIQYLLEENRLPKGENKND